MISIATARKLKAVGLTWVPQLHDFFIIPDRDLNHDIFVLSNVQATIDTLMGRQVVSFQGASEWALDSLVKDEAVWMPREDQLRELLESALLAGGQLELHVTVGLDGCRVIFPYQGQNMVFHAKDASEAYAEGLFFILQHRMPSKPG
jgi:hypothetical protein